MFSNKKRCFPPGTFIPTSMRILAIIQLCMAFTVLISYAGYPFMGELYETKSDKLLYEAVLGNQYYSGLPLQERQQLDDEYASLQDRAKKPVSSKLKESLRIIIVEIPPFEKAWITLSIAISVLLLLRIEGAASAAWVLPLIVLAFGADNVMTAPSFSGNEAALFPSEEKIINEYLQEPLSGSILEQKTQLEHGWHLYLAEEWAYDAQVDGPASFEQKVKNGEFRFNLARLSAKSRDLRNPFNRRAPFLLVSIYFLWNLFFAWFINRRRN